MAPEPRMREADRVHAATPGHNPEQVDRNLHVLPYDPHAHDPFIMLSEDWFSRNGFDWHPHRGFETVTLVLEGQLEHRDNAGGHGVLGPGDLQWTTTGRGVLHAEIAYQRRPVHTLQLWLNLPRAKKMVPPRYQDLRVRDAPVVVKDSASFRVFAGQLHDATGKADTHWPTTVTDGEMAKGSVFRHDVPGDHAAFLYVVGGALRVGAQARPVAAGQVAWFDAGAPGTSQVLLQADEDTRVIFYSGLPIREPVVARGPFVMNSAEDIIQAMRDYQNGLFGDLPEALT